MLHLITGNDAKYLDAQRALDNFGIELKSLKLAILEPQEEDIAKIAESKVLQAWNKLQEPVLISDSGWSIPSLGGFPGPFMHFVNDWFTVDDWLNLMKDKIDRKIKIETVVAYRDEKFLKTFQSFQEGIVLEFPKGNGVPIDQIASFRGDMKTIAECNELNIPFDGNTTTSSIWGEFGKWYSERFLG